MVDVLPFFSGVVFGWDDRGSRDRRSEVMVLFYVKIQTSEVPDIIKRCHRTRQDYQTERAEHGQAVMKGIVDDRGKGYFSLVGEGRSIEGFH